VPMRQSNTLEGFELLDRLLVHQQGSLRLFSVHPIRIHPHLYNGIYQEPLEQVLLYLGLSMDKNQTVNISIDGAAIKRALMPGHPTNANL
jgi:hypothetical protein